MQVSQILFESLLKYNIVQVIFHLSEECLDFNSQDMTGLFRNKMGKVYV